ncbi:UDP-glucose:undecaprenyl-phosphate glucose-1-phosphate transferase [Lentibacillus sp. JNUCC-1]|uniref:sugar transferase n=1 Tax=Lentibacillus sp. JNUCC-1 TaxID=2654513 RepID=UPI0012E82FEE|nr:sugar transferase [Lentibacillus sp. JNUCC-1]MUV36916.1 UDP-glucose:undecaprenyl-phosphate glucose-1-phosphate transferase [Lentibacillus sp. JNUCC-1]
MKRLMDLAIATGLLIITAPLIAVIAIIIKVSMGSPVLFKQQRPGLNGRPFFLYKFRTMTMAAKDGEMLSDAQRLTAVGKVLRKYSLDELPQLFNVIRNDMSLVGPRPLLMEYLPLYTKRQSARHAVKPGITGWAQVNGRNAITWEEKFDLDLWYVHHRNVLLDCKILYLTIAKVLKKEGIHQDNQATMLKFSGTKEVR